MKSLKFVFCTPILLASMAAAASTDGTTEVRPTGYAETTIQERQNKQFEDYISDLKDNYDITIRRPASFSITDTRGREDIDVNNINPKWHGSIHNNKVLAAAILEADNEEAAFIYPVLGYGGLILPELRNASRIESELRNSQDNMNLDVTPLIDIIAGEDMSQYAGADTAAVYEFDFSKNFLGRYKHCVGIYLRKAAHPAMLLKLALNDEGYKKKDEYMRLLLDNISFGDTPDKILVYSENALSDRKSEFSFPTKYRTYTGILPNINDETLDEINRTKAWLEAHGMEALPKLSDEALEALNHSRASREERQTKMDSIETSMTPDGQKIYPNPVLEQQPRFPDKGPFAENKWIEKHIRYPKDARKKGQQGAVVVGFTVMADGSLDNIRIRESRPEVSSLNEEALRLIKSMPKWIPAKYNGNDVCANWSTYISFKLPPEERAKIASKVKDSDATEDNEVYSTVITDIRAEFPGGEKAMKDWFAKNINYTDKVIEAIRSKNQIFNDVMINFRIGRDGSVKYPQVRFNSKRELSLEALRLVESMPKWIPAFENGKPVESYMDVTIKFELPEE